MTDKTHPTLSEMIADARTSIALHEDAAMEAERLSKHTNHTSYRLECARMHWERYHHYGERLKDLLAMEPAA